MIPGPDRLSGVLARWNDERGFGFVSPSRGGADVFVHISAFPPRAHRPVVGEQLTFEIGLDAHGKPRAWQIHAEERVVARPRERRAAPPRDASRRGAWSAVGLLAIVAFAVLAYVVSLMHPLPLWLWVLYGGASIVAFVSYALDKSAARTGSWRTSESSLLALGVIGGWPGGLLAQQVLRHKTRKRSFQLAFWGTVGLNVIAFVVFAPYL